MENAGDGDDDEQELNSREKTYGGEWYHEY
jgi:hypothetical protein